MGWFDFFKKRRKRRRSGEDGGPRFDHYLFAHVALRRLAFENPYRTLGTLGSPEGKDFLKQLLAAVEEYCREEEEAFTLSVDAFRIQTAKVARMPCTILEMPPPQAPPEAYMVAMVLKPPVGDTALDLIKVTPLYYTLEKSADAEGTGCVIGEWTREGAHQNRGPGPAPQVPAFLKAIEQHLPPEPKPAEDDV